MKKYNDGMAKPISDPDYWKLMTTDKNGNTNHKLVIMTLKYYPELATQVTCEQLNELFAPVYEQVMAA